MTGSHPSEISDLSTASGLMVLSWGSLTEKRWWEASWASPAGVLPRAGAGLGQGWAGLGWGLSWDWG